MRPSAAPASEFLGDGAYDFPGAPILRFDQVVGDHADQTDLSVDLGGEDTHARTQSLTQQVAERFQSVVAVDAHFRGDEAHATDGRGVGDDPG